MAGSLRLLAPTALLAFAGCWTPAMADDAETVRAFDVAVETAVGETIRGGLEAITADEVRIAADGGGVRAVPVADVRRVVRVPETKSAEPGPPGVLVLGIAGLRLAAVDFLWDGAAATVVTGAGPIDVPIERVRAVAWLADAAPEDPPAWLDEVPATADADIVAVRRDGGVELVTCAITAVSPDAVSVVLDGETIPVGRRKVVGLVWSRAAAEPAGGPLVTVVGGVVPATSATWAPQGLVVDGTIRMPAEALAGIDYAAGRAVRLTALEAERISVEPFFGGLADTEGLRDFFAPRAVPARDGRPDHEGLLVRPRTEAVWRVPADSRRFRATVSRAVGGHSPATVDLSVTVDDGPPVTRQVAADPVAVEVDVTGARRLAIVVDFVTGDMGCGVRLDDAVFER